MAGPIQDLPGELWKPVVGYEGMYEVSDSGKVRGLSRIVRSCHGSTQVRRPKTLKWTFTRGYAFVALCRDGKVKRWRVNRLVAAHFIGSPPGGTECSHIDNNKLNNRADNLRWETHQENEDRKRIYGTQTPDMGACLAI